MVGEAIDLFGDPQPGSGARFDLILGINITHISPNVEKSNGLFWLLTLFCKRLDKAEQ